MRIEVGFGTSTQSCEVADKNLGLVMSENDVAVDLVGEAEVSRALDNPIGAPRLRDMVKPGEKIAIMTSDITRPMPTATVMGPLLDELAQAGIDFADVTLVFALGSHRTQSDAEKRALAGERAWETLRCVDSSEGAFVHVGTTQAGTPVDIAEVVAGADRRICLGNIEYHYFAGYSGGAKAIMPGVSTMDAITANHSLMSSPAACAGNLDDNPVRQDLEEAAGMVGIDFILNVVLNEDKQIVRAVAGDWILAHRAGCAFLDTLYRIPIEDRFDIVIDSQGGSPKDLNLYQTQKALDNAKYAVREGGIVILVGSCQEGFGNPTFERWMREAATPDDLVRRVEDHFELGGHKASAVGKVMQQARVFLVSDMDPKTAREALFEPFSTLQEAYDAALAICGDDARVLVMPHGGSTVPVCQAD